MDELVHLYQVVLRIIYISMTRLSVTGIISNDLGTGHKIILFDLGSSQVRVKFDL